jgi:hypothetical protein
MKKGVAYFIKFFNTLVYLAEFKHKLAKSTINRISSKESVALRQHPIKLQRSHPKTPQVRPLRVESKGVGLGVLAVKDRT